MKWYGRIGFIKTVDKGDGVWKPEITEKYYTGELRRISSKWSSSSSSTNYNLNISNQVSIISDPYLEKSLQSIRYIEFMGAFYDVTDIEVAYPRLNISIGGVYNGETKDTESGTD